MRAAAPDNSISREDAENQAAEELDGIWRGSFNTLRGHFVHLKAIDQQRREEEKARVAEEKKRKAEDRARRAEERKRRRRNQGGNIARQDYWPIEHAFGMQIARNLTRDIGREQRWL